MFGDTGLINADDSVAFQHTDDSLNTDCQAVSAHSASCDTGTAAVRLPASPATCLDSASMGKQRLQVSEQLAEAVDRLSSETSRDYRNLWRDGTA